MFPVSNLTALLDPLALLFLASSLGLLFGIVWFLTHGVDLEGAEPPQEISGERSSSGAASLELVPDVAPSIGASTPQDQRPAA